MRFSFNKLAALAALTAAGISISTVVSAADETADDAILKTLVADVGQNKCIAAIAESANVVGDKRVQYLLGIIYAKGCKDVSVNSKTALDWLMKSAQQGYDLAELEVSRDYYSTESGVTRDLLKAAYWAQEAATQGNPDAELLLGYFYYRGEGVSKNRELSFQWMKKAADQNNLMAMHMVADDYFLGNGVPIDRAKGLEVMKKAADLGDEDSKKAVSMMEADMRNARARAPSQGRVVGAVNAAAQFRCILKATDEHESMATFGRLYNQCLADAARGHF